MTVILTLLVMAAAVIVFFMRRMQQGGGQVFSLRRSRAKLSSRTGKITFKDVAGVEEVKQELQEIVGFLEEPLNVDVDLGLVARGTPGFSGAELAHLLLEADPLHKVTILPRGRVMSGGLR